MKNLYLKKYYNLIIVNLILVLTPTCSLADPIETTVTFLCNADNLNNKQKEISVKCTPEYEETVQKWVCAAEKQSLYTFANACGNGNPLDLAVNMNQLQPQTIKTGAISNISINMPTILHVLSGKHQWSCSLGDTENKDTTKLEKCEFGINT